MTTELTKQEQKNQNKLVVQDQSDISMYMDTAKFEQAQRVANLFANSNIVPKHFQGSPANCFIALNMAAKLGMDPMMVMQKCYIIGDKPAIESQIAIAALNTSGLIEGSIKFEYSGEGQKLRCTAFAIEKGTQERVEYSLTLEEATKIGRASSNPNWKSIPKLMLRYRTATFLIRTTFPQVMLGFYTKEELEDVTPAKNITPNNKYDAQESKTNAIIKNAQRKEEKDNV